MRTHVALLLGLLGAAAPACHSEDPAQDHPAPAEPAAPRPPRESTRIRTPIPYGAKIPCDKIFDPAVAGKAIGDTIEIKDRSRGDADASAICSFMRAGAPPTSTQQLKKFQKENMILGVLPGDEYCMVSVYCGFMVSEDDLKKNCTTPGDRPDTTSVGSFACVHETERGPKYAYKYTVMDPDSKCRLEGQGGPSVTDEELVQKCTRLGLESVNAENIKGFSM